MKLALILGLKVVSQFLYHHNTIKISVPNSFTQDILEKRYKDLVSKFNKSVCSKLYKIEFFIASEFQEIEDKTKELEEIKRSKRNKHL